MNNVTSKSRLKAVAPKAAQPSKPKILLFGKPGVGKTYGALDFPSVYYIDTEGGADLDHYTDKLAKSGGMYLGPEQGSLSFDTVLEQVKALCTEQHGFRTLVIDSITKLFNLEISREAERLERVNEKNEFGRDKKPAVAYMKQLVSWLVRMDMNVILIAHEKSAWGLDKMGQRSEIGVTFDCWDKLEYELHLALNIQKQGPQRIAFVKKTRLLGFPDAASFPWSYDEFADRYGREVMEQCAKAVEVASGDQVQELERLLDMVKLPDGYLDKCLTAASVSSIEELDSERMAKLIDNIKARIVK